jgi:hypothetical protein
MLVALPTSILVESKGNLHASAHGCRAMTKGDTASRNPRGGMGQNVPMWGHLIDWQRIGGMRLKEAVARDVRRSARGVRWWMAGAVLRRVLLAV